jgi:hypothetical protein
MPTLRLTFLYENGSFRLLDRQEVDMVAPESESTEAEDEQAGFWFELYDDQGRTLYRQTMEDPTDPTVEVPSDDPERPFMRVPVRAPRRFVVLVPEIGERDLAFFGPPPVSPGGVVPFPPTDAASIEIARFTVR